MKYGFVESGTSKRNGFVGSATSRRRGVVDTKTCRRRRVCGDFGVSMRYEFVDYMRYKFVN